MVRVGILSAAHMHVWSYCASLKGHPLARVVGVWDDDTKRLKELAKAYGLEEFGDMAKLLGECDAVIIASENARHAELGEAAAKAGRHILCEKPLVISEEEGDRLLRAVESAGVILMTAFPCRYSPAYQRLKQRVRDGEIGKVKAVCATNRGRCPFGWFVEKGASGGGSMIDHVVHATDLMRDLLGEEVVRVQAQTGNNMYGKDWEDTAMLTLEFESGIFATLDSSWSRPQSYKTWGDVDLTVVGEDGVIEMEMFSQGFDLYTNENGRHNLASFGSNIDSGLIDGFIDAVSRGKPAPITGRDGLQAARVAFAGYESVKIGGPAPVSLN